MSITREQIVDQVSNIVGPEKVITDEQVLRENSHDRYRKYETIMGIYELPLPAAVVKVQNSDQVSQLLAFCNEHKINCVPRTGGSATEGGLETIVENSIVIDGSEMNRIVAISETDMIATAECGVPLQVLEDEVRKLGLTTGHSPQSKPIAHMGGLVATRSIGQFSTLYGGIEDMVVGLEAVFPNGHKAKIKNVPRRACGPDIRHIITGNEGALCFITEVSVKLFKYTPQYNQFRAYRLDSMKTGFEILREVMVNGYHPSIARLYDAEDGSQHGFDQFAPDQCVLIFMAEGNKLLADATVAGIDELLLPYADECTPVDGKIIEAWFNQLNWGPEKLEEERKHILANHHMGFTTEVSGNWSCIYDIYVNALERIRREYPHMDDITMLGGHSSHSYLTGTNVYFVYDYSVQACGPEAERMTYHHAIHTIIIEETLKAGGSVGHHHGLGKYRTQWTQEEHGTGAYYMLEGLKKQFDPNGIMNFGTIFPVPNYPVKSETAK
ncbi:FAD-binding oxidoreductase [Photobacterium aphoticum]|uniref:FAD-linked oxidoreductase n=1 Tax=Photobacterium aphoticum TaxID=754436 RepID=A0A0J1GQ40_9GAMM|nr:FAD-binding oxidoreductase [Photobacterium aphoticum]KLV01746.1 FAD-linked oxidoreductase [Photobacterium aphoticum]PSU58776.1 FAD-binding oxidoreductase [Photobacterium aphoticum]GHA32049.1 FAD-linked oxidoreductase [Photobacterium aphoticum]